jgi:Fe-S-cluster containining protein
MTVTDFVCRRCGNCCRPTGYVRLEPDEVEAIAAFLGLPIPAFTEAYTRLTADRRQLSLKERQDGSCIFLQSDNTCLINDAKPRQCRTFPLGWSFPGYERLCEACRPPLPEKESP